MNNIIALIFSFLILHFVFLTPVFAQAALSLSPSSGAFNKSCAFALQINLNSGGLETDGTDAIILYDQSKVTATSISSGSIYPDYPGNNIDDNSGKVTISGLASVSSPFSGTGTLATVNFTVKDTAAPGATIISFDFNPNDKAKTTDSNVVQRGTVADVLNSVTAGNYTIGTGSCTASPAPSALPNTGPGQGAPSVSTPAAQPKTVDQLVDRTGKGPGTSELTFTIAIVGLVLTVLGILGLAFL